MHFESPIGLLAQGSFWQQVSSYVYLLAAVLAAGLVALIWAVFLRRAKRRRKHGHHHHRWETEPDSRRSPHRHKHSSRDAARKELPLNPTLADVGGLPPVRRKEAVDGSETDAPQ
jgi:ABC-type nickel/cobalt efflux system permease component RcnA